MATRSDVQPPDKPLLEWRAEQIARDAVAGRLLSQAAASVLGQAFIARSATRASVIEECAKVCEQFMPLITDYNVRLQLQRDTLVNVAQAIRVLKYSQPDSRGGADG